ncbi:hypothetical protein F2P44_24165 [Massilia sp. CCM 8695]|uniref:Lipoprotein n=1 Tax=Massilia frigida TaxID=2609281 RepID=A0ABX0NA95_9BURK|nr:hypothetical protein [Massilia frigida]NHZ82352.1 hypothetical protein [Massilia frigida]
MKLAPLLLCLVLAACSTTDDDYDKYADKHSAFQLVERAKFEPINLVSLIRGTEGRVRKIHKMSALEQMRDDDAAAAEIDGTFRDFAELNRNTGDVGRARRNEIQERILGASDQRCNDFKTLLQKKQANVSFLTGLTATGSSVAATIVTNIDRSKLLAGIAGMASGYRAEYSQAFFANAAIQVVVAGIDSRRRTAYEQILLARKDSLVGYPLEAAVKDGIRYHGLCSTVAGLQEAGEAVRYYNEPGLAAASRTIARSKMLVDLQGANANEVIEKLTKWQNIVPAERYLAGNPLGATGAEEKGGAQSLLDHFESSLIRLQRRSDTLTALSKEFESDPEWKQDIATSKDIVKPVKISLEGQCRAELILKATDLLTSKAALAAAPDGDPQRALEVQLAQQNADLTKASSDFVVEGYIERASAVETALKALGSPIVKHKRPAVTAALTRLNRYAPTIGAKCAVTKIER